MELKQSAQQKHCDRTHFQNHESIQPQKIPYPKHVLCIIGTEFCERFTFFGLGAISALYLNEKLGYSENEATALYHGFIMMVYLLCIPGGIISDVWLGKFKTILYLSIVYALGCVTVSISAVPNIGISPKIVLCIGLLFVAIGSGGIKSSVCAFGGDQFKLPEQAVQMASYFAMFYFSISLGSAISTTLTPILRSNVHCFGEDDCYSLAFGAPAVLMILAIVFFLVGKSSYTHVEVSSENLLVQVAKCIWNAVAIKFRAGRGSPCKNLLDYSVDKYGQQLVDDIRTLLRLLVLYLPLPIYWTLQSQMSSRWTFQAKQMNGDIGFYHLKADQMQMVGAILLLIMVPLFEVLVYPILRRLGLRRPLQKMAIGGFLTAICFALAGLVQFQIEASPQNSVHMLWQFPQYIVLTVGEIMLALIGLEFSYQEAPKKMKAVVLSVWFLTVAVGNLITLVLVSSLSVFKYQSHEFMFFAGVMFVAMIIFSILAYFYRSSARLEKVQIE